MRQLPDVNTLCALHEAVTTAIQMLDVTRVVTEEARQEHKTRLIRLHTGRRWLWSLLLDARQERDRASPRRITDEEAARWHDALRARTSGSAPSSDTRACYQARISHPATGSEMVFIVRAESAQHAAQGLERMLGIRLNGIDETDVLAVTVTKDDAG